MCVCMCVYDQVYDYVCTHMHCTWVYARGGQRSTLGVLLVLYGHCFFFFEAVSVIGLELCKQTELAWQTCLASSDLRLQVCSSTPHDFT